MSTGLSNAFITLFEAEVKQAYQGDAVLRNSVRMRSNVTGSTVKFPKVGKGVAQVRTPQTDIVPLNTDFSQVTATMTDYIAAEYSDIFNQAKVNFDERQELAQVVGKAIARREDQIIIDVMEAASPGSTIANTVVTSGSAGASDLNIGKIIAAKKALDAANVPDCSKLPVIFIGPITVNVLEPLTVNEPVILTAKSSPAALADGELIVSVEPLTSIWDAKYILPHLCFGFPRVSSFPEGNKLPTVIVVTAFPSKSYKRLLLPVFCNRFWKVDDMNLFVKSNDISYNPYFLFDNL